MGETLFQITLTTIKRWIGNSLLATGNFFVSVGDAFVNYAEFFLGATDNAGA